MKLQTNFKQAHRPGLGKYLRTIIFGAVLLGTSLLREIDKGLAKSRVGIVLVTPSLLKRISAEGIAENITFVLDSNNPNQVKIELTLNDKSYSASPEVKVTTLVKMENM